MILLDAVSTGGAAAHGRLAGVSLQVPSGDVQALVAEDSAALATIADLLLGRIRAASGAVRIGSVDAGTNPVAARRLIGLVSAGGLDGRTSVRGNAQSLLRLCGLADVAGAVLEEAWRRSEVPDRFFDRPAAGLRPRDVAAVWLAIASIRRTPVLLCYQLGRTLSALDARHLAKLLRQASQRNHAVLILDQDPGLARRAANRVSSLRRGRLVSQADGSPNISPGHGLDEHVAIGDEP